MCSLVMFCIVVLHTQLKANIKAFMSNAIETENQELSNKVIGALADAFGKSLFTIRRWIDKESDLLTSDKAKDVFKSEGVEWPLKKSA